MALLSDVFLGLRQLLWTLSSTEHWVCLNDYFAVAWIMVISSTEPGSVTLVERTKQNFYWLMKTLQGENSKIIIFHSFGWWTWGSDSWRQPVSFCCNMEGRVDWHKRKNCFSFSGEGQKDRGESAGFSLLPLFFMTVLLNGGNHCLQELFRALVKSCGLSCVLICGSAVVTQIWIYSQIRLRIIDVFSSAK